MENKEENLRFPEGFLWGVSTSAYQIEGGITNDWSQWEMSDKRLAELRKKKLNYKDFVCGRACDSYNRYEEDTALVKSLNCNAYRFGLEWARIEPVEGEFSAEAIEHCRLVLSSLKRQGIKTVVTIWHWTNPMWLVLEGGWTNKKAASYFARYTRFVAQELGDLVDYWVVLNEPMVHIFNGYVTAKFPPNKKNIFKAIKVFNNLVSAQKKAYKIIHEINPGAQVGLTALINYFEPARKWNILEVLMAAAAHYFWNYLFLSKIKNSFDYIGPDYYFHDRIVCYPPFIKNFNKETTDFGWEIYPRGIYKVLKYLKKFKKPILIMENGIADALDSKRGKFIVDHLRYVHKAITEGADVRGYFHWSLLDNFEWAAGWPAKFGLFEVNRETFERHMRPSARVYAEIARDNKIK